MFEDFKEMSVAKICTESKSINLIFLIFFFSFKNLFFPLKTSFFFCIYLTCFQ